MPSPSSPDDPAWSECIALDEVAAPPPIENPYERDIYRHGSIEEKRSRDREQRRSSSVLERLQSAQHGFEEIPAAYDGLDEIAAPTPNENLDEGEWQQQHSLERIRSARRESQDRPPSALAKLLQVDIYTIAYLIFFAILGTLARLGLQALTFYPNAPVLMSEVWVNVGGCFILGFLQEDKAIFSMRRNSIRLQASNELDSSDTEPVAHPPIDEEKGAPEPVSLQVKKTLPPYIGLSVGFCGSFTSFSSMIRDVFLSLSNDLSPANPGSHSRYAGYSAAAVSAVLITEIGLSLAAHSCGAHLAIASAPLLFRFPNTGLRRIMNPLILLLGPGCWVGAVLLTIWPTVIAWRGEVLFALVFAPLGCLLRFALALTLNSVSDMFPLGTFAANVFGTLVLGLCYDLQRASPGRAIIPCQILQGVEDGFSGCLTTVSTWVAELNGLRRKHAYAYGTASVAISLAAFVVIVGTLRWTVGFEPLSCKT